MNEGLFNVQINDIERILNRLGLLQERNNFPDYQDCGAPRFRNRSYREIWEICFAEKYYDFVLLDYSLIQFRTDFQTPCFGYAYYETPHHIFSYSDYLIQECGFSPEELPEVGDMFRPEYEMTLATSGLKEMVTPIRYDYDAERYVEGRHPASHVHLGHNNNIRIGTRKLLRPISFLMFVLRQCYPEMWIEFLRLDDNLLFRRNVRHNLDDIDDEFCNPLDEWEMILH